MITAETRSMRIFAMATMGLLLAGIAMLAGPVIGDWSVVLGVAALLVLLWAILLAVRLDSGAGESGLSGSEAGPEG